MRSFRQISAWINQRYSKSLMLALFLIVLGFFWVFNFSQFPISNAQFTKLSGHEGLLDTMFLYSSQTAFTAISHYGEEGRKLYPVFLATDFVFILFYSLSFAFLITATVRSLCGYGSSWLQLNILPIGIGLLDGVENICILGLLKIFPSYSSFLGTFAGIITCCKWLLTIVTIAVLLYGGILIFFRRLGLRHCIMQRP